MARAPPVEVPRRCERLLPARQGEVNAASVRASAAFMPGLYTSQITAKATATRASETPMTTIICRPPRPYLARVSVMTSPLPSGWGTVCGGIGSLMSDQCQAGPDVPDQ